MNNKFWFITVLIAIIGLVACNQEEVLPDDLLGTVEEISVSALPASVVQSINASYPSRTIASATQVTGTDGTIIYAATLDDGTEVSLDHRGGACNDTIPIADLPAGVETYVNTNYPGEMITRAASTENAEGATIYIVRISSGEVLSFDANGTFLEERQRRKRGKKRHRRHGEMIDVSDLPVDVNTYVTANHAGETIEKAVKITLPDGTILYMAKLSSGDRLVFDENGAFLRDAQPRWR